jgi:predicted amidohydrolase
MAETKAVSNRLKVGVVQMTLGRTIQDNLDRIVTGISNASTSRVRVVVFPEGALQGKDSDQPSRVDQALQAIRRAARDRQVYVVFGGSSFSAALKKNSNWMRVVGPEGQDVFQYEKIFDNHHAPMPGVFLIDGVLCSTMICADRWLRGVEELPIQQGAQISFELSCNFASEWVAPFGWYWYVPRAMRNNVWVIFANTGNKVSGVPDDPSAPRELRHGHSAIIAPDGKIIQAAQDDVETLVVADVEVNQATRSGAMVRAAHPVFRKFWEAGLKLHSGQTVVAPALTPLKSAATDLTVAVAQVISDLDAMEVMIKQARAKNADFVVFPARAIAGTALPRLQAAAREQRITVVVGMEHREVGGLCNSAFVIGPDGAVLTRYDQLSATSPFQPGANPATMWFRVKGVPAVVTLERDALWTELAELAAVAGAQIHVHLDYDLANDPDTALRRLQSWSNLASYQTFTITANPVDSAIWDDLRGSDERRAEVRDLPRPETGPVEVYSPFSANLVVRAWAGHQLIIATRHIGPKNLYHPQRTTSFNPQMDAWYRLGAALIHPQNHPTEP